MVILHLSLRLFKCQGREKEGKRGLYLRSDARVLSAPAPAQILGTQWVLNECVFAN